MFKKIVLLFFTIAVALSACSTLTVTIDLTPHPTQSANMTATPEPILVTATLPAPEKPTTLDPYLPAFTNFSFYRTSTRPASCGNTYQNIFPARILQVHARWDYTNMHAGLLIRREWYHNGIVWATYNETWDFAKYGAEGSINDMPIYDFDAGLEPGNYELRLYIDGQAQFNAESPIGFVVDEDWSLQIASPNDRLTAVISEPQKLMIREANDTTWELVKAHEISSLAWFADSRHIVYADTDRSQTQGCTTIGIRYTLWVVDAATSTRHQIGSDNDNLHDPLLSPNQQYIAALSGSGFGDACAADLQPAFIKLDNSFQEVRRLRLQDFAGIPTTPADSVAYSVGDGVWKDETHFETRLGWTCGPNNNPSGMYVFDLTTLQATRTGDLPNP
jgi:hypothetical protein